MLNWPFFAFNGFVLLMLAVDLYRHDPQKEPSVKHALLMSLLWIALAVGFNVVIALFWEQLAPTSSLSNSEAAWAFAAGYLIEKSLSVDNLFVFAMIFTAFNVPRVHQHTVLFYGVVGALVMRGIMIAVGSALVSQYHFVLYIFAVVLIVSAIKMLRHEADADINDSWLIKTLKKYLPITDGFRGDRFTVIENGKRMITPLMLVVIVVELSDVMFAIDSIPAIFSVTTDPFLVYTANVMAILGLRSLFFVLESLMARFAYLHYGLAIMLAFVGVKMLLMQTAYAISTPISLSVIVVVLAATIAFSLYKERGVMASQ